HDTSKSSGNESFVSAVNIGEREILFEHRNVIFSAQLNDIAAGDAAKAIIPAAGPHFPFANNEEMCAVTGGDKPVRVKHQRFVCACLSRLNTSSYAIQFTMRVKFGVLHCRIAAPDMHGEKADAILHSAWQGFLIFRDDDYGRGRDHHARVLIWR